MNTTRLDLYQNPEYQPGPWWKRALWHCCNALIFNNGLFPFSSLKVGLLKVFGASVGNGVTIKPNVNIKHPWLLNLGSNVWIGENVWIDNLVQVTIGSHVCLSQGSFLLTGNHNYKSVTFDLILQPIILEDGAWIGAKAVVCPGVVCRSHSVLSVGSVAVSELLSYTVYSGNPATAKRKRIIS